MGATMRFLLLLGTLVVLAGVASSKEVHSLDSGAELGESAGMEVHMKLGAEAAKKKGSMWAKMDGHVPPAGSEVYKTIDETEEHGKCRFACYQDKICGGYMFTPGHHKCELIQAPNWLVEKGANDAWHKEVAYEHTGADYEEDKAEKKEEKNLKNGLKQMPKRKSRTFRTGAHGHLKLDLEGQMKLQLESDASEDTHKEDEQDESDAILAKVMVKKTKLYQEFYERYAHEYESRAEACAKRKAHKIAKKRVSRHKLYVQARKEVDGHCVRKFQRAFMDKITEWGSQKMYDYQERLKNEKDKEEMEAKNEEMKAEEEEQKKALAGKQEAPPPAEGAEDAPAGKR